MINKPLIILAGGFGTRLQSILNGLPKPLANINGVPFLQYLLQNWINKGFNDFIFSLHFESNKIIDFLESQKLNHINCKIRYVVEPTPMGTGGAISFLLEKVEIEKLYQAKEAEKASPTLIIIGYLSLIILGIGGAIFGLYIVHTKKTLIDGSQFYRFDATSRNHGKIMLAIFTIILILLLLLFTNH